MGVRHTLEKSKSSKQIAPPPPPPPPRSSNKYNTQNVCNNMGLGIWKIPYSISHMRCSYEYTWVDIIEFVNDTHDNEKAQKNYKSPLQCVMRLKKSLATRFILLVHTNIMESVKASRNWHVVRRDHHSLIDSPHKGSVITVVSILTDGYFTASDWEYTFDLLIL